MKRGGTFSLVFLACLFSLTAVSAATVYSPGLRAEFFDYSTSLSSIPDLTGKTATVARIDSNINYGSTKKQWSGLPVSLKDTYASRHKGFINITLAGEYIFYLKSDDGSKLFIDGNLRINHDGRHSFSEKASSVIYLSEGYHSIEVLYFDNSGNNGLVLYYKGPGISKQIVPSNKLFYDEIVVDPVCGNGVVELGETCDSGTRSCTINGYSGSQTCNSECTGYGTCTTTQRCGDGIKNGNEVCDGNSQACSVNGYSGTQECNSVCSGFNSCVVTGSCGDGIINGQEQCDDGNNQNGDGCSSQCLNEICQNNWVCTAWSECTNNQQTRVCNDANSCGNTAGKPSETQSCGESIDQGLIYTNDGSDLTGANGVTSVQDGFEGNSLNFDGVDDYLLLTPLSINKQGSFAYSFWVKANVIGGGGIGDGGGDYIIDRYPATTSLFSFKEIGSGQYGLQVRYDDGSGLGGPVGGQINVGNWQHIVLMRDYGNSFKLYVDGFLVASTIDNGKAITIPPAKFGLHASALNNGLNGRIDEIRIYNRSLSEPEVLQLASVSSECGNSIVEIGEQCDDGNQNNLDSCTNECKLPVCGDSIIQSGEQCDDGNLFEGDGCSVLCKNEFCGNNICDYHLVSGAYVQENTLTCSADCKESEIQGTSGNDVFQVYNNKVYVNKVERKTLSPGETVTLNGLDGDDTFVTVGAGTQKIIGGSGLDIFWVDSTDSILDSSNEETLAKTVNSISFYYQPWTNDVNSQDYIPLESLGQNLRDPIGRDYWGTTHTRKANFAGQSLYGSSLKHTDVAQGGIGDCYLLAPLASMANNVNPQTPELIRRAIVEVGDGTYIVRFYRYENGQYIPVYIRIDGELYVDSNNRPVFAKANDGTWVALIEKAYVYFATKYGGQTLGNEYNGISGGQMYKVNEHISGSKPSYLYPIPSTLTVSDVQGFISNKKASTTGSISSGSGSCSVGIVTNHAYAQISTTSTTITNYNPWGPNNAQPVCTIDQFRATFVQVARLS